MKKIVVIILVAVLTVSLAGCKKSKEADVKTKELIDSIGEKIAKDVGVSSKDELDWSEVDLLSENGLAILEMMNLDPNILQEAIYYENPMNVRADRIIIAKVKEEKDVNTVKLAFDELKKAQETDWEQYLPEQYEKVKNGQVFTKDKFVFYIVYDDVASIKKIVDDALVQ
ncbi:DUF4358 domain-containing protein [Anaerosporobacter sp.]